VLGTWRLDGALVLLGSRLAKSSVAVSLFVNLFKSPFDIGFFFHRERWRQGATSSLHLYVFVSALGFSRTLSTHPSLAP